MHTSHTAMVISPHADDAAAFCGGTLAKFADQGWRVIVVRVTDDARDSVGLTLEETKRRNTAELHRAAAGLGVSEIVELGYETDCLADVSEVDLRERFVYLFRKHRPYAVFTFDPYQMYEDNMDHIRVAQAVEEAFWVSRFDLHHPEHFEEEGLEPFAVCEHWYFGRQLPDANHAEDVSAYMEQKVEALCAHRTMMQNAMNQYRLQLQTWGRRMPWLESAMEEDMRPLLALFLQEQANGVAEAFDLGPGRMGEAFRLVRFGDLEELFQMMSEPLSDAQEAPRRESLDVAHESPWSEDQMENVFPVDVNERIRIMGHHHLCAGAFEELFAFPLFRAGYPELVKRLRPNPDVLVESIYGYDLFCYQCGYWSEEEGRCVTGWKNKISKDAAVLKHLGLRPGQMTRLEDLQRLLAERVTPADLERFCGPAEWKCEFYLQGVCQRGYEKLRKRFGIEEDGGPEDSKQ